MISVFPHFSSLTLDNKKDYDKYIADLPPYSDILFPTLQIWWNIEGDLSVASLGKNLVISYSHSYDHNHDGYCLVGQESVDTSIATIFEYLRKEHKTIRLIHVPEFVIKKIENPSSFRLMEELDYNEYIIDCNAMASLSSPEYGRIRRGVGRFLRETKDKNVEIRSLDLSDSNVIIKLTYFVESLEDKKRTKNDPLNTERDAIRKSFRLANQLDIENLAIYIEDELCGFILFHRPNKGHYYIGHHLKVNYDYPYIFDYAIQQLSLKGLSEGVEYLNMEMDLGIESLRAHKMKLRPVEFFRKYTILPK